MNCSPIKEDVYIFYDMRFYRFVHESLYFLRSQLILVFRLLTEVKNILLGKKWRKLQILAIIKCSYCIGLNQSAI